MLNPCGDFVLADLILLKTSLQLYPEFSTKILENYSNDLAYSAKEY